MIESVLLVVTLAVLVWRETRSPMAYTKFKAAESTQERQRFYTSWLIESFLVFGLGAIMILFLLGRLSDLVSIPDEFHAATAQYGIAEFFADETSDGSSDSFGEEMAGFFGGLVVSGIVLAVGLRIVMKLRKKNGTASPPVLGDVAALYPKNSSEKFLAALLSLNAGLSEELMFRLALPLLITLVTHSVVAGIVSATLIFGFIHFYQGWLGILGTTLIGTMMMAIYLVTEQIWIPMLIHAAIDINGLLVMPLLFRIKPSSETSD